VTTVAEKWFSAIEAKRVSTRVLAVARLFAEQADEDGLAQIGRNYIEKASHAGSTVDAAKGLKVLLGSGWLVTLKDADQATRTPRTFKLTTPGQGSVHHDHITH
jgi:hypothetical protein